MDRALLLDRNYLAISIIPLRRAINLMVKGKAEPVSDKAAEVKTGSGVFKVPTIIRLLTVVPYRAYTGKTKFSRKNVMIRDNFECQYCGEYLGKHKGTIDHVIPRSRGGASDYGNCVTCCKPCNALKADRTLEETGFKLRSVPRRPSFIGLYKYYLKNTPEEWSDYLIGA